MTTKAYDALADWSDDSKRPAIRKILLSEGFADVIARLDASATSAQAETERSNMAKEPEKRSHKAKTAGRK